MRSIRFLFDTVVAHGLLLFDASFGTSQDFQMNGDEFAKFGRDGRHKAAQPQNNEATS